MVSYGMEELKWMNFLEEFSGVTPKDLIVFPENIIFLVPEGSIARCIGKGGVVAKKLENLLKKRVKFIEYSTDLHQFVRNLTHPLEVKEITQEDAVLTIHSADHQTRGMLIGRNAANLRAYELIIKRHFPISELKIA